MKTIYSILSVMIILALTACSNDPFVGEWVTSNDTDGNTVFYIKSDGTMAIITDADDGYAKISGSWTRVSDSENTIKVKFDANTIELDFDNPLIEVIMQQVIQEYADAEATLILSEDGNSLLHKSTGDKAFVKK